MASWLLVLALPFLVISSRVNKPNASVAKPDSLAELESGEVPEATRQALMDWAQKKAYRYIILPIPSLDVTTGSREKNYADFKAQLLACPGVCIGGFDFEWEVPRGHGTVGT